MIRFVSFKYVDYDLGNIGKLHISPVRPNENPANANLIKVGEERYLIEAEGNLSASNISQNTLNNFDDFLLIHIEALRRLT